MKLNIISVSAGKPDTLLQKCLKERDYNCNYTFAFNNSQSICKVYNEKIASLLHQPRPDDDFVVFVHDDVQINIDCGDLIRRLEAAFNIYDVVGIAGIKNAKITFPALWHLMSDPGDRRGAVSTPIERGTTSPYHITSFGPMPDRVSLIDGVFMATTIKVIKQVKFDESNPARFHFYDLDFSLQCNANKFKVGVWDIPIIHQSPGLSSVSDEWKAGQEWFIKKWS